MLQNKETPVMDFWSADDISTPKKYDTYKILIADDEAEVHTVTNFILEDLIFEDKQLELIHSYTGSETMKVLEETPDIAVVFLDVVMESSHSGLDVVRYIRRTLKNKTTRIIIRTGQPGYAPEEKVIRDYDINDYRLKTEMTAIRVKTSLYSALRSYRDMISLEKHKQGLEQIISSSARMFTYNSIDNFLNSLLNELSNFHKQDTELVYIRENDGNSGNGFISLESQSKNKIVAATGKYKQFIGQDIESITTFNSVNSWLNHINDPHQILHQLDEGFIIQSRGNSKLKNLIYIEGPKEDFDYKLINLFLSNYSIALDNFILGNLLNDSQKEILYALGEMIESHFEETGSHIKRLSEMMSVFAHHCGYSAPDCEMLKIACTMHDIGKVAIPDAILKKPGRLTAEEFEIMKTHVFHGHKIMSSSKLPILKLACEIALNHHEKWYGTGYPNGLKGLEIPKSARMLAILDVFDAMSHKRIYKDAISIEETLKELTDQKGLHFDPELVDIFIDNIDDITKISKTL